jgi:hypothetical protein
MSLLLGQPGQIHQQGSHHQAHPTAALLSLLEQ